MRWAIVGLATACAVGVGMLLYGPIATTTRNDPQNWPQRELAFLKSAHDRIQVDLASANGGSASLRREEDTILRAIAAVAKQMPAGSVPNDIRVLLPASDPPEEDAQAAPIEPAAIARSVRTATPPTGEGSAATPPPAVAVGSEPSSPEAPTEPVVREASSSSRPFKPPPLPAPDAPRTLPQLEAALHAEKTDRGLRVILPAETLFGAARDAVDPAADSTLSNLAALIEAMQPREIIVIGHIDSSIENDANPTLSKKRARAVTAWLAAHGSPEYQPHFVERGYARTRPVAPNGNAGGSDNTDERQERRWIEILLRRN